MSTNDVDLGFELETPATPEPSVAPAGTPSVDLGFKIGTEAPTPVRGEFQQSKVWDNSALAWKPELEQKAKEQKEKAFRDYSPTEPEYVTEARYEEQKEIQEGVDAPRDVSGERVGWFMPDFEAGTWLDAMFNNVRLETKQEAENQKNVFQNQTLPDAYQKLLEKGDELPDYETWKAEQIEQGGERGQHWTGIGMVDGGLAGIDWLLKQETLEGEVYESDIAYFMRQAEVISGDGPVGALVGTVLRAGLEIPLKGIEYARDLIVDAAEEADFDQNAPEGMIVRGIDRFVEELDRDVEELAHEASLSDPLGTLRDYYSKGEGLPELGGAIVDLTSPVDDFLNAAGYEAAAKKVSNVQYATGWVGGLVLGFFNPIGGPIGRLFARGKKISDVVDGVTDGVVKASKVTGLHPADRRLLEVSQRVERASDVKSEFLEAVNKGVTNKADLDDAMKADIASGAWKTRRGEQPDVEKLVQKAREIGREVEPPKSQKDYVWLDEVQALKAQRVREIASGNRTLPLDAVQLTNRLIVRARHVDTALDAITNTVRFVPGTEEIKQSSKALSELFEEGAVPASQASMALVGAKALGDAPEGFYRVATARGALEVAEEAIPMEVFKASLQKFWNSTDGMDAGQRALAYEEWVGNAFESVANQGILRRMAREAVSPDDVIDVNQLLATFKQSPGKVRTASRRATTMSNLRRQNKLGPVFNFESFSRMSSEGDVSGGMLLAAQKRIDELNDKSAYLEDGARWLGYYTQNLTGRINYEKISPYRELNKSFQQRLGSAGTVVDTSVRNYARDNGVDIAASVRYHAASRLGDAARVAETLLLRGFDDLDAARKAFNAATEGSPLAALRSTLKGLDVNDPQNYAKVAKTLEALKGLDLYDITGVVVDNGNRLTPDVMSLRTRDGGLTDNVMALLTEQEVSRVVGQYTSSVNARVMTEAAPAVAEIATSLPENVPMGMLGGLKIWTETGLAGLVSMENLNDAMAELGAVAFLADNGKRTQAALQRMMNEQFHQLDRLSPEQLREFLPGVEALAETIAIAKGVDVAEAMKDVEEVANRILANDYRLVMGSSPALQAMKMDLFSSPQSIRSLQNSLDRLVSSIKSTSSRGAVDVFDALDELGSLKVSPVFGDSVSLALAGVDIKDPKAVLEGVNAAYKVEDGLNPKQVEDVGLVVQQIKELGEAIIEVQRGTRSATLFGPEPLKAAVEMGKRGLSAIVTAPIGTALQALGSGAMYLSRLAKAGGLAGVLLLRTGYHATNFLGASGMRVITHGWQSAYQTAGDTLYGLAFTVPVVRGVASWAAPVRSQRHQVVMNAVARINAGGFMSDEFLGGAVQAGLGVQKVNPNEVVPGLDITLDQLVRELLREGLDETVAKVEFLDDTSRKDIVNRVSELGGRDKDYSVFMEFWKRTFGVGDDMFWGAMANQSDQFYRVNAYIDARKAGKSPTEAGQIARDSMLDYSKLTEAERSATSMTVFVYSFKRLMGEATLRSFLNNPQKLINLYKLREKTGELGGLSALPGVSEEEEEMMDVYTATWGADKPVVARILRDAGYYDVRSSFGEVPAFGILAEALEITKGMFGVVGAIAEGKPGEGMEEMKEIALSQGGPWVQWVTQNWFGERNVFGQTRGLKGTWDLERIAFYDQIGMLEWMVGKEHIQVQPAAEGQPNYKGYVYRVNPDSKRTVAFWDSAFFMLGLQSSGKTAADWATASGFIEDYDAGYDSAPLLTLGEQLGFVRVTPTATPERVRKQRGYAVRDLSTD